jgi:hypothetical protein
MIPLPPHNQAKENNDMWVAMWVEIKNTPKGALNIGTWRRRRLPLYGYVA